MTTIKDKRGKMGFIHICFASDMHPYNCDGKGKCEHCDRAKIEGHNPATCALCDPEYDFAENPYWKIPKAKITTPNKNKEVK